MKGISRLQLLGTATHVGLVVTATAPASEFDAMSSGRFARMARQISSHLAGGPVVRILLPPAVSPQTIGPAGDFTVEVE